MNEPAWHRNERARRGAGFVRKYARAASTVASCCLMRTSPKALTSWLPTCLVDRSARQAARACDLLPLPRPSTQPQLRGCRS